jgi:signal transduction histidine kinase
MATLDGHVHSPEADLAAELQASRMRIVEAADGARRQIERDLHDGAQQRFVSASLLLSLARRRAGDDDGLAQLLAQIAGELEAGLADLRELAHGIHPTVLTDRGLRAAIAGLAARSRIPVEVDGDLHVRPAPTVESALYFTVAEALTNVAKYANASSALVTIVQAEHHAEIEIRDDGRGGAEPLNGSGLRGLVDRLGALGGHLHVESPLGEGTTVRAIVPLDPRDAASELSCGCCAEGQCRCAA